MADGVNNRVSNQTIKAVGQQTAASGRTAAQGRTASPSSFSPGITAGAEGGTSNAQTAGGRLAFGNSSGEILSAYASTGFANTFDVANQRAKAGADNVFAGIANDGGAGSTTNAAALSQILGRNKADGENNAVRFTSTTAAQNTTGTKGTVSTAELEKLRSANRINEDGSVNPYTNANFDDFKNYGRQELENYFGDLDKISAQGYSNTRGGGSTAPEYIVHKISEQGMSEIKDLLKADSETKGSPGLSGEDVENMMGRTSEIIGRIFEEGTEHFENSSKATLQKFEDAGMLDLIKDKGITVHDQAEVLSHAMKNNTSVEGLKDMEGIYSAYLEYRDKISNTGRVTNSMADKLNAGQAVQGKDHGIEDDVDTKKFKDTVGKIAEDAFLKMTEAAGYDSDEVRDYAKKNLGVEGVTNFDPSIHAAMTINDMLGRTDEKTGQTGWDKLVQQAEERDGVAKGEGDYSANAFVTLHNDAVDMQTDGEGFVRSEGGLLGLDAMTTVHSGGIRNNPMAPNTVVAGFQGDGSASSIDRIDQQLKNPRNAGLAEDGYDNITFSPSGHGSKTGVLQQAGRADADQTNFGVEDYDRMAKVLVGNTREGGKINIDCDACFGGHVAKGLAQAVQKEAVAQDKAVRIDWRGSINEGSKRTDTLGEKINNGDTVVDADGSVKKIRGDMEGQNNIMGGEGKEFYGAGGKEAYAKAAKALEQSKIARAEGIDKAAKASNNDLSSNDKETLPSIDASNTDVAEAAVASADSTQEWGDSGAEALEASSDELTNASADSLADSSTSAGSDDIAASSDSTGEAGTAPSTDDIAASDNTTEEDPNKDKDKDAFVV